jgi:hypothetical protein
LADNNVGNTETILSINYDGINSQKYGATTYIINASINATMNPTLYGVPNGGWGGNRSTSNLPLAFGDYSGNTDKRAMFYGNNLNITNINDFTQGVAVVKFKNLNSNGTTPYSIGGSATNTSSGGVYASTDFPLFRLAEMYLICAEATLRGGTGGTVTPLAAVNMLRTRAYGNATGNLSSVSLTDVLNERTRELYWEGFRRTDLIRYGLFTSASYLWPYKGGVQNGKGVESYRTLFPIPNTDLVNNPNLVQNPGY